MSVFLERGITYLAID